MTEPTQQLGYCTNVHAGADLATTRANLQQHALAVKERFCPDASMGLGLWLSASAARSLLADGAEQEFAAWLSEAGLLPFTFNGFPFGDFHQRVVKHRVYQPTWFDPQRLDYTRDLIRIQHALLPHGMEGSISTLPIAWRNPEPTGRQWQAAADNLRTVAAELARLESDTGRLIHLGIEPEPGCLLDRSEHVVEFFERHLLPGGDEDAVRRHIRVCHDVCHAAVMFEPQAACFERYRRAGIRVGKVQISSAVCVPFDQIEREQYAGVIQQLSEFHEPRYLHQTCVREGPEALPVFYEDLDRALSLHAHLDSLEGAWRIHFHVPIYLTRFGHLTTSRPEIHDCLAAARQSSDVRHFEVETYAWDVLPEELKQPTLAMGIARELAWFRDLLTQTRFGCS